MGKRNMVVDTSALAHAAWHAYPQHLGADGSDWRVLAGILSKLRRLSERFEWDVLVAVLDNEEGSAYRKSIFPEYKAHRPPKDPELERQLAQLPEALWILGFDTLRLTGVESDDLIGSFVAGARKKGELSMILTPDKDMAQLVGDGVWLLKPNKGEKGISEPFDSYDAQGVYAKYGVWPEQIPDWLALQGDVSDNIPGVKGVGPKKAAEILSVFATIEDMGYGTEKLKGKLRKDVEEALPFLGNSKLLTKILLDVDVETARRPSIESAPKSKERAIEFMEKANLPAWAQEWVTSYNFAKACKTAAGNENDFDQEKAISDEPHPFGD